MNSDTINTYEAAYHAAVATAADAADADVRLMAQDVAADILVLLDVMAETAAR